MIWFTDLILILDGKYAVISIYWNG